MSDWPIGNEDSYVDRRSFFNENGAYLFRSAGEAAQIIALEMDGQERWRWSYDQAPPDWSECWLSEHGLLLQSMSDALLLSTRDGSTLWHLESAPWEFPIAPLPAGPEGDFILEFYDRTCGVSTAGKMLWAMDRPWLTGYYQAVDPSHPLRVANLHGDSRIEDSMLLGRDGQRIPGALPAGSRSLASHFFDTGHLLASIEDESIRLFASTGQAIESRYPYQGDDLIAGGFHMIETEGETEIVVDPIHLDAAWSIERPEGLQLVAANAWGDKLILWFEPGETGEAQPDGFEQPVKSVVHCYTATGKLLWVADLELPGSLTGETTGAAGNMLFALMTEPAGETSIETLYAWEIP